MMTGRRQLMAQLMLGVAVAAGGLPLSHALALGENEASQHVRQSIEELLDLARSPGEAEAKAPRLLDIIERRAAMPQIARFAAGANWRIMNEDQQARYVAAFGKFLSGVYARRFQEYSETTAGEAFTMDGVIDAGRKGMLVKTSITRQGAAPVLVEWLVSDQPGRVVIADIVIEGISLLITQREEIGAMLEARGGNVEKLISDLGA